MQYKLDMKAITAMSGESQSVVYDAVKAGDLETFLVGRRRFARPEAVKRWVDFLEQRSREGRPVAYRARRVA